MIIVREESIDETLDVLRQTWRQDLFFVLLPAKSGLADAWLESSLRHVPDDLERGCFAMLTSGSTGEPKLVVGSRARAERLAAALHEVQMSEAVEETVLALPLSYSFAFVNQWVWSNVFGRRLIATAGFQSPRRLGKALSQCRNAMLCLVGAQVPLLEWHFAGTVFAGVTRLHFAGGRFPQERLPALCRLFPRARIFNNYGCAEAMPRLTVRRAEDSDDPSDVGRPLPGIELRTDGAGQLTFRSPYGAVGLLNGQSVKHLRVDDWVPTADLAEATPDGTWRLRGRASEVFKRHGEKISLAGLRDSIHRVWWGGIAFYRETDSVGEEGHVLLLAPHPTKDELRSMLRILRARHRRPHWPLRIESVENFLLSPNGKVDAGQTRRHPTRNVDWRQRI